MIAYNTAIGSAIIVPSNNKIIVTDTYNQFFGTVDNTWSNPLNWSLGIVPSAQHTVQISANCTATTPTSTNYIVKALYIDSGITLNVFGGSNFYGLIVTAATVNNGTLVVNTNSVFKTGTFSNNGTMSNQPGTSFFYTQAGNIAPGNYYTLSYTGPSDLIGDITVQTNLTTSTQGVAQPV